MKKMKKEPRKVGKREGKQLVFPAYWVRAEPAGEGALTGGKHRAGLRFAEMMGFFFFFFLLHILILLFTKWFLTRATYQ